MATYTRSTYRCDSCGKELKTCNNHMAIQVSKSENNLGWSRLRVIIEHRYGSHNDGKVESADLCHECAVVLLRHALSSVLDGERATAGTFSSKREDWDSQ